jgi:hypothetical protein
MKVKKAVDITPCYGKLSFDSQIDKYDSQLSCDASPEAYLSLRVIVKRICHLESKMWQIRLRWSITGILWSVFVILCVKWYFSSGPFYSARPPYFFRPRKLFGACFELLYLAEKSAIWQQWLILQNCPFQYIKNVAIWAAESASSGPGQFCVD